MTRSTITGAPSQKATGLIDLRNESDLEARIKKLEELEEWLFAGLGGALVLKTTAEGEKELTAGPKITVPRTGTYLIGMSLRGYTQGEGANELFAGVSTNGGALNTPFFDFVSIKALMLVWTTNWVIRALVEGQQLSIRCRMSANVESTFDSGGIFLKQVA